MTENFLSKRFYTFFFKKQSIFVWFNFIGEKFLGMWPDMFPYAPVATGHLLHSCSSKGVGGSLLSSVLSPIFSGSTWQRAVKSLGEKVKSLLCFGRQIFQSDFAWFPHNLGFLMDSRKWMLWVILFDVFLLIICKQQSL